MDFEKESLEYHESFPRGKIFTGLSKPVSTQRDLSLAYTPGVAGPCRAIAKDENLSFRYTGRGNLVAVITNGTAVLGLGNIGPYAAKPVMEGKAMLFKKFANIDVIDLELAADDPEDFIKAVKALEPTIGGINLEDIKAPECFYIERRLREEMKIPVFHDDQHGTAIIAGAAFINALEVTGRKIDQAKVVFSGGGAAAVACANLFLEMGVRPENLILCDSKGVIHSRRKDLNEFKQKFVRDVPFDSMMDALKGADAFVGVSAPDVLTQEMLMGMAKNPIVFALANPDPEIKPHLALEARPDVVLATGRSDFPNQVNNVLGFPFIFRGALDVRATTINEAMKLAAVKAIAQLAKEDVPDEVITAYNRKDGLTFGRDYLIPKPVDPRVLLKVAPAVAKAAMDSGVARQTIDLDQYEEFLEHILGPTRVMLRRVKNSLQKIRQKTGKMPLIALTRGADKRVMRAAMQVYEDGGIRIGLIGHRETILANSIEFGVKDLEKKVTIFDPYEQKMGEDYALQIYQRRSRKGVTMDIARQLVLNHNYFGAMLLESGHIDGLVNGLSEPYQRAIRPIMEVIGIKEKTDLVGVYLMVIRDKMLFFADCTINPNPNAEQLAHIAIETAAIAKNYTKDPIRIAMLSFGSFGSNRHPEADKVRQATQLVKKWAPDLVVDGEMQADVALDGRLQEREFPFCALGGPANILVFPDLNSANIGYKMVSKVADATPIGPILSGIKKPANVLQRGASSSEIISMIYVTAFQIEKALI